MNDHVESSSSESGLAVEPKNAVSAGSMLRRAREAEGLHIAALAVSLKVPVNKIEAIEADRFDLLPDLVFARALALSICRVLKVDSTSILEKMPTSSVPLISAAESGINVPFRVPGQVSGVAFLHHLSKPVVLAVVALLIGALVLWFGPFPSTISTVDAPMPGASEAAQMLPSLPVPSANPVQVENVATVPLAVSPASTALPNNSDNVVAPSHATPSSAPLDASSPTINGVGSVTSGLLVLTARDSSWVEVIDGAKVVQVRKTLRAGEVLSVSGMLPLAVVLGRADAIAIQVRGQPFEATAQTKDNIARFEVK